MNWKSGYKYELICSDMLIKTWSLTNRALCKPDRKRHFLVTNCKLHRNSGFWRKLEVLEDREHGLSQSCWLACQQGGQLLQKMATHKQKQKGIHYQSLIAWYQPVQYSGTRQRHEICTVYRIRPLYFLYIFQKRLIKMIRKFVKLKMMNFWWKNN